MDLIISINYIKGSYITISGNNVSAQEAIKIINSFKPFLKYPFEFKIFINNNLLVNDVYTDDDYFNMWYDEKLEDLINIISKTIEENKND